MKPAEIVATCLSRPWLAGALVVAAAATGTILGAYVFEYVVGLPPCPLCLQQRVPYYAVIPAALAVAFMAWRRWPGAIVRLGLLALAGLMIWGAGLGVYHAGAEWGFWQGPTTCAQPTVIARNPADLLRQLQTAKPLADCTVAAWRFLGLSLAGWNVVIASALALVALAAASRPREAGGRGDRAAGVIALWTSPCAAKPSSSGGTAPRRSAGRHRPRAPRMP